MKRLLVLFAISLLVSTNSSTGEPEDTKEKSRTDNVPFLTLGVPLSKDPSAIIGRYTPDGRVVFDKRPVKEWEFMATGTGITGLTVSFPDEMLIQVNHSASIDELAMVRALSRLHLNLEGSPFKNSTSFRMETDFRRSVIFAEAQTDTGKVRVEIRAHVPMDAFRIDIFDERKIPGSLSLRFEEDAPSVALASANGMLFFHENPKEGKNIDRGNRHWLAGRTFGLCVESAVGDGVKSEGGQMTVPALSHQVIYLVGASDRNGKDAFLKSVAERMRQVAALSRDEFISSHEAWWRQFWARSYFEPNDPSGKLIRYRASFDLVRYYMACCASDRREIPVRFQIELYRYHLRQHRWLTGIFSDMYQFFFSSMRTGDWEPLRSEYQLFKENLPFFKDQAQRLQGVDGGAYIPYSFQPWPMRPPSTPISPESRPKKPMLPDVPYNGDNPAGALFVLAMACDYAEACGDRAFAEDTLRPLATEVLEYMRLRYPSGEDGKIAFDPCNGGETWRNVKNPAEVVCAFRFALLRVISVGEKHDWPKSTVAQWRALLAAAPDIPRGKLLFDPSSRDVKPVIMPGNLLVPASDMTNCKSYILPWSGGKAWYSVNRQQTEMYAIWPTRLMLRNEADIKVAKESYEIRPWQYILTGWNMDVIDAACLGLREEVSAWFDKQFDHTYVFPCGLAQEEGPINPARPGIPEYASQQAMSTGVIPVLEMLLADYPDLLVILPCWDPKVAVRYALFSPYAGKVTVDYDPACGATVKTERPIRVEFGKNIQPAKQK